LTAGVHGLKVLYLMCSMQATQTAVMLALRKQAGKMAASDHDQLPV
jgi:hypothetical protein